MFTFKIPYDPENTQWILENTVDYNKLNQTVALGAAPLLEVALLLEQINKAPVHYI